MATKNTKEQMIQFIAENKAQYAGKTDLTNLEAMTDEDIQKVYRALKTKVWNQGRKKPKTMADRIAATQSYDECVALRREVESYLPLIDERMAALKAEKIESLKAAINDKTAELKELEGQKKK